MPRRARPRAGRKLIAVRVLIYGCGFTGEAFARRLAHEGAQPVGSSRSAARRGELAALGVTPVDPDDTDRLGREAARADAVLISAPPAAAGCPGLRALGPALGRPDWIGYLSTTGVYGDRSGGWVDEDAALDARTPEAVRRVGAETQWRAFANARGLALSVFRLPGIYGPGRSPLDRVRAGRASRLDKPGQVFSRIHVDDLADALVRSLHRPGAGAVFNLCDDTPAPSAATTACAARLLGMEPPPLRAFDPATLSPMARRFWSESKRVSNARAKAALGWRPAYPGYAEGFAAVLAAEQSASAA